MNEEADAWVAALCDAPRRMRRENVSLRTCLIESKPDLSDDVRCTTAIERYLMSDPDCITAWQRESDDTRGSPNHYVNGRQVGFYDDGFHDQLIHDNEVSACADFIYRKTAWVLQRRRVRRQDG